MTTESRNLARTAFARPWLLLVLGVQGCWLLGRFAANRVRRAYSRDVHKGAKRRPPWLGACEQSLELRHVGELVFPVYPALKASIATAIAQTPDFPDRASDQESYLAKHRWLECSRALTATDQEVAAAVRQCGEWLRVPPPRSDPAWEPYSAAERIGNLLVLLAARPEAREYIEPTVLRRFLEDSLSWIDCHLEYYGPTRTNNHVLNDARAIVMAGAVLGNGQAVEKGLRICARMGQELFQPGGFLRERSAHYQVVVTNWLLDTLHFGRIASSLSEAAQRSLRIVEALVVRASGATSWLLGVVQECGTFIGDLSPDSPPRLSIERITGLYPQWVRLYCHVSSGLIDDWAFLSLNDDTILSCTLAKGFPPRFPTHGHNDVGHFVWHRKGQCLLADSGRARYSADARSQAQASAEGHNVLLIDGLGPVAESLLVGRVLYARPYSNATVKTTVDSSVPSLTIVNDGFRRMGNVGIHIRTTEVTERGLVVVDRIDGRGAVTLETLWHFAPGFSPAVRAHPPAAVGFGLVVSCTSLTEDGRSPTPEWQRYCHSAAYGVEATAPMLRLTWKASLPAILTTTMVVSPCAE